MQSPARAGRAARCLALAAASLGLAACLARPPAESAPARLGAVRAATRARAEDVARTLDRLAPRVVEVVPGAHLGPLEVWLQETPALYAVRSVRSRGGADLRPGATRGRCGPVRAGPAARFPVPTERVVRVPHVVFFEPGTPILGARPSADAARRSFSCFQAVFEGRSSSPE